VLLLRARRSADRHPASAEHVDRRELVGADA